MLLPAPDEPLSIEEVVRLYPKIRQSLLAKLDDCPLSTYFELRYSQGWNTHPQARGTLFHRFAADYMRTLRSTGHERMPVSEALEILIEVCHQRNVAPEDIVRVPLREMKDLRMAAIKFANDNSFSVQRIVDVEKRLEAPLVYVTDDGEVITRILTGQIDLLLYEPPSGAVVLDWKDTWGLPPEPREVAPEDRRADDDLKGISYHGFFQQRFYGWLVMKNYANIESVTLREFYVRKTKVRKATLYRHQLDDVEEELRILAHAFDRAISKGAPQRPYKIATLGEWAPSPGRHCGFCVGARKCPIEEDTRIEAGGSITSPEMAARAAAELTLVNRVRDLLTTALKGWVETTGRPVPVKYAKGRQVLGWFRDKRGRRFGLYVPDDSDRGGHEVDKQLEEAMKESTELARAKRSRRRKAG